MPDIKLFVCCHQRFDIPKNPLLVPIQVGAALSEDRFPGFLYDDEGENISGKNKSYCELTAQYWAWKNVDADYYGFFHYRRFLYPDCRASRPYCIMRKPTEAALERMRFSRIDSLINSCDLIAPMAEDMHISVREYYHGTSFHHAKDLEVVEGIIRRAYPEYVPAMETYLNGSNQFFGNIFIMRKDLFYDYSTWLFRILDEFDRFADLTGYTPQERRVNGYLGERLFGVYCIKWQKDLNLRYLPRVLFEPDYRKRLPKRVAYFTLPPGTKRRAIIKSCAAKLGVR